MRPNFTETETRLDAALPSRRDEAWKWTDVRAKLREDASGLTARLNPKFVVPDGIHISEGDGHAGKTVMGKIAGHFAGQSWNIYVPAGTQVEMPLTLEDISRGHGRIAMMIDKGATLNLIEFHGSESAGFANIDMHIHMAEGASLHRIIVHEDAADTVRTATTCVAMEKDANLSQFTLSFGGALSRLETRVFGEGAGVKALINGAYLLDGERHTDMTSHIDLSAPDAEIRQAVKGVVTDKARGVFQGKFHVHRAAQKTDAEMRHDALMLSDTAQVRAKPELEIYADDVECAHGNTLGALDESALFYMRQRGIPLQQARALLTEAFLVSVFDDVTDADLRASLIEKIQVWLAQS